MSRIHRNHGNVDFPRLFFGQASHRRMVHFGLSNICCLLNFLQQPIQESKAMFNHIRSSQFSGMILVTIQHLFCLHPILGLIGTNWFFHQMATHSNPGGLVAALGPLMPCRLWFLISCGLWWCRKSSVPKWLHWLIQSSFGKAMIQTTIEEKKIRARWEGIRRSSCNTGIFSTYHFICRGNIFVLYKPWILLAGKRFVLEDEMRQGKQSWWNCWRPVDRPGRTCGLACSNADPNNRSINSDDMNVPCERYLGLVDAAEFIIIISIMRIVGMVEKTKINFLGNLSDRKLLEGKSVHSSTKQTRMSLVIQCITIVSTPYSPYYCLILLPYS